MPISRAFPYLSSSLPSRHSLHDDTGNAGYSSSPGGGDGNNRAQQQRRLTRQRKLRHVTDDELGLRFNDIDRSFSSPGSPDTAARKSRNPDCLEHWSSSAVPKPLPLPELFTNRKPKTSGSSPGPSQLASPDEEPASAFGRKDADHAAKSCPAKLSANVHKGFSQVEPVERVNNGSRQRVPTKSSLPSFLSTPISPRRQNTQDHFDSYDVADSTKSLLSRRKGSHDLNFGSVNYNLRLNVPARSAPTTALSSPSVSPQRSKTVDPFPSSSSGPQELRGLIDFDALHLGRAAAYTSPVSPVKTVHTPEHSPLHSPGPNKILFASSRDWLESNSQVNAHPLPLPPGALPSSQSSMPLPSPVSSHNIEKPIATSMISQWQKGRLLGRGTYGSVYEATNRETGALCAMKEVDIIPDDPKSVECIKQLEQEIRVLRNLKHRNIVQYYGSEIVDDHFYIYLEYVHPGSINKYVREHCGAITESIVRNFTRHVLSGLAYLHSSKTIHRDIKGANLLVDANGVVKLADFGMAKHLTGLSYELSLKGSPYWMAPEVIKAVMQKDANPNLALAVDIWSLGCTIIEMFNGKPPWSELEGPQAMFKVLNRSPPIPEALSLEGKDFLHCCFRRNPAERPSAVMLLEHPFVRNSADQNGSAIMQAFSRMNVMDKPHSPRSCPTHKIELMTTSLGTRVTNGKLPYNSETGQSFSTKTINCAAASHHLIFSTLEVSTYTSATGLIRGSHSFSPSSHVSSNMPLGTVNNHPCALGRTQGKEVPHI
ncbi:PREDICTED: mitogen-activated protein kinase kinase kinase YODA isoform X1 [Theobroma cacao]|uniref:mitogen-activated protein kinase kinase kinase n=2 Tax=Theobroma cacao TaxID=3641 RepID=A0AB32UU53_THECC|nr:PREDICTED: mitogen-activated protein kinase kinase kinase YODA isoform X1 [Theobroma cacao]